MAAADDATHERELPSNEDYTVGWICALPIEFVAAQAFLDQVHEPAAHVGTKDNNSYALGCMGKHSVVICVPALGEYGSSSASRLVRDMIHAFPSIRAALLVGIGGAAPSSNHDIRLGDIIVGESVLQLDFGKTNQDQILSVIDPAPDIFREAIGALRAEHEVERHDMQQSIDAILAVNDRLREIFSRPDAETDRLHKSDVIHPAREISCAESCGVDETSLILRASRNDEADDPTIHYGLIASSNQVLKDAKHRDWLANEHNILCFEMEAAGLMSHFPCLLIRGICDYADSHKNKQWQGYAAMTAAAYAKKLLDHIQPTTLEAEREVGELSVNHFNQVKQWLSPSDPSVDQQQARQLHQPGTSRWFLDSEKYMSWRTSSPSFLCVYGPPGSGKTFLCSAAIADLQETSAAPQYVLYFYFRSTNREKNSTENAIRSLIFQLYRRSPSAREEVDSLYASYEASGQQPTFAVLQAVLNTMLQECGETWIILDGLDECVTRSQHAAVDGIVPWIRNLTNLLSGVHLLVASRPEQDIKFIDTWTDFLMLQPDLVAADIEIYIRKRVEQMVWWQGLPEVQELILTSLNGSADGMFLWVSCQLDILERCLSKADVINTLAEQPRSLVQTYAEILRQLPSESEARTIRLLQILTCSPQGLLIHEALDTLPSQPRFDTASQMFIEEELSRLCGSLVHLTRTYYDNIGGYETEIRLIHFSVREYLQSDLLPFTLATYFKEETLAQEFPDELTPKYALGKLIVDIYSDIPTGDRDNESDASVLSDVSSVFTESTDLTSLSLDPTGNHDILQMAALQTLAHRLYHDSVIHDLYYSAVQELGSVRFAANHDRLLKIFWKDFFGGTTRPELQILVRVLAKRRSRTLVTAHIVRLFQIDLDSSRYGNASRQQVLSQQEDRNYTLNQFLRSQQLANAAADTDDLEDSANDDDSSDEDDAQGSVPKSADDVERMLDHITDGTPYQTFKSNLACLAHPPTNLAEALNTKNLRAVKRFIRKEFDSIAQDEYAWLQDLEDLGHTRDEIAEILLEEAMDSPWIYFTPAPEPLSEFGIERGYHLPGCVHRLTWNSSIQHRDLKTSTHVASTLDSTSLPDIQRLCGLAGITPSSRDVEEWNGSVGFEQDNSTVWITYGHPDIQKVIHRLEITLRLLCTAIRQCQTQQLCCDSFTIIELPSPLVTVADRPSVEVHRIDFLNAFRLLQEVRLLNVTRNARTYLLPTATKIMHDVFHTQQLAGLAVEPGLKITVHECSLAIQMMCLGFLSYLQAHVGPLHPVFLDTPIRSASLLGSAAIQERNVVSRIELNLVELSCVGKMLRGPVLVFKLVEASIPVTRTEFPLHLRFDMIANAEDLVDTWGPAQFIVQDQGSFPCAIKIGGGIISASDSAGEKFHWHQGFSFTSVGDGIVLDPTKKVQIGSPVSVNINCVLDVAQFRVLSEECGQLRYLGTSRPVWERTEHQLGIQAGQYIVLQANAAYHRHPGRTLKEYRLGQGDDYLVSFLDEWWAVQVSLCTNVARRVPLRQMVADLLPVFASTLTHGDDCSIWESLRADGGIFGAFRGTILQQWLRDQPASHHSLVLRTIRYILTVLSESGLDRRGKTLLVSWPYGSDVYQCLEISLNHQESSWAQIIADSEDAATFAYASPCCLETEEHRCRKNDSSFWRSTVPLLETAVTVHVNEEQLVPPATNSTLVHGGKYFFKTFHGVHIVKVEQPDPRAVAKLVRKDSRLPVKMSHRLYARTQLRERGKVPPGGHVAWLTSSI